jgi:quinol monooxygenase YgiN
MWRQLLLLVLVVPFVLMGAFAQEMKKEMKHDGKVTVIVSHEVKDYAVWRKGYDADEANRKKAGFKVSGVYTDVKNPNVVTIIGEFSGVAAADAFFSNPMLKDVMEKAGVVGKPTITELTIGAK